MGGHALGAWPLQGSPGARGPGGGPGARGPARGSGACQGASMVLGREII